MFAALIPLASPSRGYPHQLIFFMNIAVHFREGWENYYLQTTHTRYMAKTMALVFGIILVLIGLLGFVGNPLVGANGLFVTNGLHNIVHIVFGIILVVASRSGQGNSALWLKILGFVFLVLAVLGFLLGGPMLLGIVAINTMDQWLHLVLGVVLLIAGMRGNSAAAQPAAPMGMA